MRPNTISPAQLDELLKAEASYVDPEENSYSLPFLRLITSAERGNLSRSFSECVYTPGQIVFHEGDSGDSMFLVWSGKAAIIKGIRENLVVLAFRKPGEIFGEMALLENQPRSASVVALEPLRLLEINRARFEQLLSDAPNVSRSIMGILSARLRRMNDERSTGELSEKRLSRQVLDLQSEKKRLEELQNLRQETTELIIHDLRNPLSAVAVSLKMLAMMLPEDALRANQEILGIAQASCDRMQRLVDSLLEVSRIEDGDMPFAMSAVDLQAVAAGVIGQVSILARSGVTIASEFSPDLPPVWADADKIERVLMNLLDNALKYSPKGGNVEVRGEKLENGVRITVSDDGPGVPPEERERIFERFAQVPGQHVKRRGFGLGLTYCRLTIERHGGRIWVEPGPDGTGSRFVFFLPVAGGLKTQ